MYLPALQEVDLGFHAPRLFFYWPSSEAGLLPHLDPVRLGRIAEHFHAGGDVGFSGQGDDLFRILFEDIDFGRNVDLPVLPTDPQDRVSMIKAKVLAIIEAVKAVLACGEIVDFKVRQDQPA